MTEREKKNVKMMVLGAFVGLANGLFGGGGGMLAVPLFQWSGLSGKKSHATCIALILPLCLATVATYTIFGGSSLNFGKVEVGVLVGGVIGAVLLKKLPSKIISFVFYSLMIFAGIKLVLK